MPGTKFASDSIAESPPSAFALEWVDTLEKALARLDAAALIVLTASEDAELAFAALGEGAEEYLIKGDVSGPALARRLRLAIARRQSKTRQEPAPSRSVGWVSAA